MTFTPRLTIPEKGNPYYNRKANGGYSTAILGKPICDGLNVLSNCVGYAHGRFHEICGDTTMSQLCPVNAELFIDYASKSLKVGNEPKLGAVIVWQRGATKSGSDGAGHVAIVEQINADGSIVTSESGYGSSVPFYTNTRVKGNGNWGQDSNYKFLGFIYQKNDYDPAPTPTPTPTTDTVTMALDHNIYRSANDALAHTNPCGVYKAGEYYVFRKVNGCTNISRYKGSAGAWISDVDLNEQPTPTPTPTPTTTSITFDVTPVSLGCSGDYVKPVQVILKGLGFYNMAIDGSAGNGTKNAILAYQKARGLATDGCFGSKCWKSFLGI